MQPFWWPAPLGRQALTDAQAKSHHVQLLHHMQQTQACNT